MKRFLFPILFSLFVTAGNAQEWFTSFDVAKRLARVQDKMLFVVWEASFDTPIPMLVRSESEKVVAIDLSKETSLDSIIWEYFVPVRLPETLFSEFSAAAEDRDYRYLNKLNDNSIKIMDVNGNIMNVDEPDGSVTNLTDLITKYALNTAYLKSELDNYADEKNFLSSSLLGIRYIDYAIFAHEDLRSDIIDLSTIYLNEAETFLSRNEPDYDRYLQKIELARIKQLLILNAYRKASRQLKRIDHTEINEINTSQFAFLNYVAFTLMKDEINAESWKSKISSLDLIKAERIIKNNTVGRDN
ncbi:MAG: hypothetical protein ACSHXF_16630 [Aquaticitalea sp.]